ncbi:MAG: BTAD domain-containing putative transcriptional regulator [Bacillota bacterium]
MPEAKMRIKILGSFRLIKDHNVYDDEIWKSKKALQIFKYLVSQQGKKVPKDIIMELFWPDNDLDQVANLHTTIYYIRKTLDQLHKGFASCLKSSKGLYSFESKDYCIIDINEFDNFYNLALNNHKEKKIDKALNLYYQTINLYQGDFLQEDLYDDWAYILRQEYREKYIDIILRTNYILSKIQEKYIEANNICEKGLNIDPYREELYRSIIYNYIKSNNYIYAIKRYKEYSKMLEQEFDLEPVQEIKELFEGLDVAAT